MHRLPSLLLIIYAVAILVLAIWMGTGRERVMMPISALRAVAGLVGAWGLLDRRPWARWLVLALVASEVWAVISMERHAALIRDLIPHFTAWRASHWLGLGLVALAAALTVRRTASTGTLDQEEP